MPLLNAYISAGALSPSAEQELLKKLTDLLLEHEGVDPGNRVGQKLAWIFVHRPETYVAGAEPQAPRYRFDCWVPEGQYNDERRAAVVAGMTQAVAEAEQGAWPHPERRVVMFTNEVKDGIWGGDGRVLRLPDIYQIVFGEDARADAEQVLATRRREEAEAILAAAGERAGT